ncbi:hypothetical protein NHX12_013588 [Muraenolepis orangiensis]|uniref:Histidine N-acetyltransferase n=1 Tax=Muraenolepis orangiensis TaxID=630683 RepID=A0A9Q0DAD7_9TELE|nr:hypothetical protein NHX12_013588 [Muraenolepis orangiensis]
MKIENSLPVPQHPDAPSQTGLQFTVATEEDFDDIMAMSHNIYGGLDYLPTRYTDWMQEANRTVVLARKQGKVIALESVCVIDDGETMLVEGLRVAPQDRGKGVAGELLRFCSQLTKAKYPEVKVCRLTRDDQLGPKDFQKYRLITKQGILLDVLPNGTVVQDWQPFKLLAGNMDILLKKDIDWTVDDEDTPTVASLCTFPFRVPIGEDWYYLNIDVFGKDPRLVRQQCLAHLRRHTAALQGHVMCQVFLEPGLWTPMAEFCLRTLKVELVKEYTEQCVVEADVV